MTTEIDFKKLDEIILALLYYSARQEKHGVLAWKSLDWGALERLFIEGLIGNPISKGKSVLLTAEGNSLGQQLFEKHFSVSADDNHNLKF
jgi:hypothetical protein